MRAPVPVRPAACFALAITIMFAAMRAANAQPGGDITLDAFRPALDSHGYITVDGTGLTPPGDVAFGLYTTWAHGLLRLEGDGARYSVRDVLSPTLVASFGVPRLPLELGLSLPFGVVASDRDPDTDGGTPGDPRDDQRYASGSQGLGDLGVHAKLGLGRFALAGSLYLPTAAADSWLGAGAMTGQLRLAIEGHRGRLRAAANLGVRVRASGTAEFMDAPTGMPATNQRISLGAAVPAGGALAYALSPGKLDVLAEAYALVPLSGSNYAPIEALGGLKVHLATASYFTIGGGVGLGRDAGNPDVRAFGAIVFEPGARTSQHAAIPDEILPPPATAASDDRDGDHIVDSIDACPDDPEDFDRIQDQDGCPETDADRDMVADDIDFCAETAEDVDGVADDDGCPESDADHDKIADLDDKCPTRPENYNRIKDGDGCPDNDMVSMTDTSFDTLKPIYFEFDSAIIKPESYPVVDAIAAALNDYAHLKHIEIGGHTDSRGSATYNLKLSRGRAAAVRTYLIEHGVAAERLTSEGYGETLPIDKHRNEAAYATNRRVEFLILDHN